VEIRSSSEWAASAKIPRLPDNPPTSNLRAAKLPLATTEAVVIASLDLGPGLFFTGLFESYDRRIPSSGLNFVGSFFTLGAFRASGGALDSAREVVY
jgi:hypothetical protein